MNLINAKSSENRIGIYIYLSFVKALIFQIIFCFFSSQSFLKHLILNLYETN